MDTFRIVKSAPVSNTQAVSQLEKFISKEKEARADDSDVTNTTRARISDDIFTQMESANVALKQSTMNE